MDLLRETIAALVVLAIVAGIVAGIGYVTWLRQTRHRISTILRRHFRPVPLDQISVNERLFPHQIRADLHQAVEGFLARAVVRRFTGLQIEAGLGGADFSSLLDENPSHAGQTAMAGPPQYEQIDIGEDDPVRTLKAGLWLAERDGVRFAVLCAPHCDFGGCGIEQRLRVQIASTRDDGGERIGLEFFDRLESAVERATCYRGKILSLESDNSYIGYASGVKVHRLSPLQRDQVILPQKTLDLLDRNVIEFVRNRERLSRFQMSTKKGLLFYGPPGTGKTHTIRYLACSLDAHTTLLISAEQVALLSEYMTLARLLQPSLVVIEDVDLIARERTEMHNDQTELLLNKLLNEMDGLREDCQILFILTTNRPEELEAALASRPGRIDQAIEFPLPDAEGREKLVHLYSRGMVLEDEVVRNIVSRTENVSASFIKELMRRSAQFCLERDGSGTLSIPDVKNALDEMLFSGGSLNLKLLGAGQWSEAGSRVGFHPPVS